MNIKHKAGDYFIYNLTTERGEEIVCLVRADIDIFENQKSAYVRFLECYNDSHYGAYNYLAKVKQNSGVSVEFLHNITNYIKRKDELGLTDFLTDVFGVDPMYFGVDGRFIAYHVIEHYEVL